MSPRLTKKTVQSLVAPAGEYREVWDSDFKVMGSSFGVRVSGRTGSKSWVLLYRRGGRGRRITLGSFPAMSLAQARERATAIASRVVLGADPAEERRAAREAATFAELAERFVVQWPKLRDLRPSTAREYERIIRRELLPRWGERKAFEIGRGDIIDLLDEIRIERGAPIQSNRVRALLKTMFGWAVTRDLVPASPAAVLPKRPRERSRDRVLADAEVAGIWALLDEEAEPVRSLFRFMIATGQRVGETRLARWADVLDGIWTIPEGHTKARRAHRVPLSPLALSILADLEPVTGKRAHVFASPSARGTGPIQWITKTAERLRDRLAPPCPVCGRHGRHVWVDEDPEKLAGWYCECRSCETAPGAPVRWSVAEPWRPHDLRRTMATGMRRLGVDRIVVERAENRTDASVASVYDRYAMEPEVRAAFNLWGAYVERITAGATESVPGSAAQAS